LAKRRQLIRQQVTLLGIVTLISLTQPLKVLLPMLVTLSGIVTLVSMLQSLKAFSPILVTGLTLNSFVHIQNTGFFRQQLKRLENCAQRDECRLTMKSQLIAIVAAVVLVGCGPSEPQFSELLHHSITNGNIEAVEQHIAAGADVNAKDDVGKTPLDWAKTNEVADLLRKHGGKTGEELKAEGK